MCGIMGYYSFGNTLPDKNKIEKMFVLLESRGRDASGFAFIDNISNQLKVTKAPVPSSHLIKSDIWKSLLLPKKMIFHTRMKTQGDPQNNMNNHPLFTKEGIAIVHNGMIYNDKEIFSGKIKRDAQVDSEAILGVMMKNKKNKDLIKTIFDSLEGIFAVAMINQNEPNKLILIKKNNPIELYYNSKDDILYFASERGIMQNALDIRTNYKRGFGIGENEYHNYEMEDNHGMVINEKGVESYKCYFPKMKSYSRYDFNDEVMMECPFCLSKTKYNWIKLNNRCEHCGRYLDVEDIYV